MNEIKKRPVLAATSIVVAICVLIDVGLHRFVDWAFHFNYFDNGLPLSGLVKSGLFPVAAPLGFGVIFAFLAMMYSISRSELGGKPVPACASSLRSPSSCSSVSLNPGSCSTLPSRPSSSPPSRMELRSSFSASFSSRIPWPEPASGAIRKSRAPPGRRCSGSPSSTSRDATSPTRYSISRPAMSSGRLPPFPGPSVLDSEWELSIGRQVRPSSPRHPFGRRFVWGL